MKRSLSLDRVQSADQPFDIVVIGGGASGLGAAVDAAARGHSVALFEQCDFAKGTSSKSTKLVHGGVRYLQQGNVSLVLEALHERGRLAKNAPHLVRSQAFVIPSYKWWQKYYFGIGMKMYDALAGKLGLEPSRRLSRSQTLAVIPTINSKNLTGGVRYSDGQFDDSRLAVNLAQTAEDLGAAVVNYCRCTSLVKEQGKVCGVEIHDIEGDNTFTVKAKAVINATGVFVDDLRKMDEPKSKDIVAVSQGIHMILPKRFLPGNSAIMIPKTSDGRVLFAVPWHDHVVLGTTDTPLHYKSLEPRALEEEKQFVIEHARKYLTVKPTDDDVCSIFAGLRPLVKAKGDSENTKALSRDHTIMIGKSGLVTLTGGKWTTYRRMAEDVINQTEDVASLDKKECVTKEMQIHGWTQNKSEQRNLAPYGSDASHIKALIQEDASLAEKIHPALDYQKAEVVWHAREEMARSVEDVLARRTRFLLLNAKASIEAAPIVAEILSQELGCNSDWVNKQIEDYTKYAKRYVFTDASSVDNPRK